MTSKASNRYKQYLESEWYKNHLEKGGRTISDERKEKDFKTRKYNKVRTYLRCKYS